MRRNKVNSAPRYFLPLETTAIAPKALYQNPNVDTFLSQQASGTEGKLLSKSFSTVSLGSSLKNMSPIIQ